MNLYLIIATVAYSLFAINGIIDKFLLTKGGVKSPAAYAFYIGITGFFTWAVVPFGLLDIGFSFSGISSGNLIVAIIGGASFILALQFLYIATQKTSISRLLPIEGGLVPVFTFAMSYFILGERLEALQIMAFLLLVVGAVIISLKEDKSGWHMQALGYAVVAAFLFALSLTLTKYTFDQTNFLSGLVYTRLGFILVSLIYLIPPKTRYAIFNSPKSTTTGNKFLYLGARVSGGIAGFLQNFAISLGSVTIVNAMQGTQYAILLIGTVILSKK
ncbi:MAG: DMT family transporter, partial [Candidatus Doudnabacteria bacterium]